MIKAFGVFEGGGAKGLAHVGALKAAEEHNVKFEEVAGSSAGAIVASLVAAGCTADKLFDPRSPNRVFDEHFVPLLGRWRWQLIRTVRWLAKLYRRFLLFRILCLLVLVGFSAIGFWLFAFIHDILTQKTWISAGVLFAIILALLGLVSLYFNAVLPLGVFSSTRFESWLNDQLGKELDLAEGTIVRFNDLKIPLTIIVTDLRSRRPIAYDSKSHPEQSVAKVVAYSMSIPLAFRPHFVDRMILVDGGVLSNFPAWVFDEQRAAASDLVYTLGFRLHNASPQEDEQIVRRSMRRYLADLGTVFFGDSILQIREIDDLHLIPIQVTKSTLDFDLDRDGRCHLFQEGYYASKQFFKQFLGGREPTISSYLELLHNELLSLLGKGRIKIRVNIAMPIEPLRRRIRVLYKFNMDPSDCDDRLELNILGGGMGRCWEEKRPILIDMVAVEANLEQWRMTKYEQALVRKTVRTLVSIPIFYPSELDIGTPDENTQLLGVLNIDSDTDLLPEFAVLSGTVPSDLGNLIGRSVRLISKELVK